MIKINSLVAISNKVWTTMLKYKHGACCPILLSRQQPVDGLAWRIGRRIMKGVFGCVFVFCFVKQFSKINLKIIFKNKTNNKTCFGIVLFLVFFSSFIYYNSL